MSVDGLEQGTEPLVGQGCFLKLPSKIPFERSVSIDEHVVLHDRLTLTPISSRHAACLFLVIRKPCSRFYLPGSVSRSFALSVSYYLESSTASVLTAF